MNYLKESERTMSIEFHGELVAKSDLMNSLMDYLFNSKEIDAIKKALFYGKRCFLFEHSVMPRLQIKNQKEVNILHSVLGIATEAGELIEAWLKGQNSEIDVQNIKEEIGDLFWYAAILAREFGFSFEEIQEANIQKLYARYPEKFTAERANNRNLKNEEKALNGILGDK